MTTKIAMEEKIWPSLYKLNAAGKPMIWAIGAAVEGNVGIYTVQHGQVGGSIQSTSTKVKAGKNIGQANETTLWEQTCAEAQSHWNKQKDRKGYTTTIPSAKPLRPMLAKSYDDQGHHITFPCYWQPKLDGIRCLAYLRGKEVVLVSRQGKEFKALDHIKKALLPILKKDAEIILDGELYRHGEEFQELASAIKRDKPSADSHKVQYHVYDLIADDDFGDRFKSLWKLLPRPAKPSDKDVVRLVWTQMINHANEVDEIHDTQTLRGYEGIMLRNTTGKYQIDRRSSDLQKVKKFTDGEFEIVGVEECRGKMEGMCAFQCITKSGTVFKCMPEGSEQNRKQMYKDWLSGKIKKGDKLTIRYFALTTSDNPVPRFPVGIAIRDYE